MNPVKTLHGNIKCRRIASLLLEIGLTTKVWTGPKPGKKGVSEKAVPNWQRYSELSAGEQPTFTCPAVLLSLSDANIKKPDWCKLHTSPGGNRAIKAWVRQKTPSSDRRFQHFKEPHFPYSFARTFLRSAIACSISSRSILALLALGEDCISFFLRIALIVSWRNRQSGLRSICSAGLDGEHRAGSVPDNIFRNASQS